MRTFVAAIAVLLTGATAHAQVQPSTATPSADDPHNVTHRVAIELTTLNVMLQKGIISQAEYDSALRDMGDSLGGQSGEAPTLILGRWSTTLYGFVEADNIWDSTESFNDLAGNGSVAKGTTYAGSNGRFTMGVRNSRLGFRLRAPEYHRIRASAMLEMDFLGNQAAVGYAQAFQISENAFFTNPAFRVRHMNLKVETPWVDILFGQYWQLFGWQSVYHPNSVQIQGLPGQIYSRTPQIRLSKTIRTAPVTFEAAIAMMRSPDRDSWLPEGQAGVRLAVNPWTGVQTAGATGTAIQPLSVALTADVRQFNLPEFAATPKLTKGATGWGFAADAFIPLIPARKGHRRNSLSINGEYAIGRAIADLYTGLSAGALGVTNAALPNPTMATPAPTFNPDADPGMVVFTADGALHTIQTQSVLVGVQYYLPVSDGRLWVAGNFSRLSSDNASLYKASAAATARTSEDFADANLFWDATPSVRLGFEYAWFRDNFSDGTFAVNHRYQLSAFYLF